MGRGAAEQATVAPAGNHASPVWRAFVDGAGAACVAEAATLPLEVTKGLEAGFHKQFLYTGLRLGLYDQLSADQEGAPLHVKVVHAIAATGLGIVVANPSDVVQTKYITHRGPLTHSAAALVPPAARQRHPPSVAPAAPPQPPAGKRGFASRAAAVLAQPHRVGAVSAAAFAAQCGQHSHHLFHDHRRRLHSTAPGSDGLRARLGPTSTTGVPLGNARRAYYVILREEGLVKGLYRGFGANFACNCLQGASEIATYDLVKHWLLDWGFADGVPVHLASGMSAGFMATVCSNPLDIVSTRIMAAKRGYSHAGTGMWRVIADIWKDEGVLAFYKGFGPNILRIGSFNIVMWMVYEQIRKLGCS